MANRIDDLITVVEAYCEARGLSEGRVSTLMFSGGKRINELRAGADMGSRKVDAAFQWLSNNWPDEADWPAGIDRPAPLSSEAADG